MPQQVALGRPGELQNIAYSREAAICIKTSCGIVVQLFKRTRILNSSMTNNAVCTQAWLLHFHT